MKIRSEILKVSVCLLLVWAFVITLPLKSNFSEKISQKTSQSDEKKSEKEINSSQKKFKTSPDKPDSKQRTLKTASPETIVSFSGFQLLQVFYWDFLPKFPKILPKFKFSPSQVFFVLSYFENTFCHHIAINAP